MKTSVIVYVFYGIFSNILEHLMKLYEIIWESSIASFRFYRTGYSQNLQQKSLTKFRIRCLLNKIVDWSTKT